MLTAFIGMDGSFYKPGVCVVGKKWHPDWQAIWPAAVVEATPNGSSHPETFAVHLKECLLDVFDNDGRGDASKVLIMDTGGGSGLHVSPEITLLCMQHNIRPWVLPSYTAKALMALDQTPHGQCESEWATQRRRWAWEPTKGATY